MWNEIINLLKIQIEEGQESQFDSELLDLNDWVRREYGKQGLTCEELRLAYNALVKEELTKEGRTLEAYPRLDPRHVGEVIAAYRRTAETSDVTRVISQGLYVPESTPLTEDQVDHQMTLRLEQAIDAVKRGILYFDLGNGLYEWLYKKGRIQPSNQEWEDALIEAQQNIRESLTNQKKVASRYSGFESLRTKIGKRLEDVINETGDFKKRVRSEAFQICLTTWLMGRSGVTDRPTTPLPTMPPIPSPDPPKAFTHLQYIESLTAQLPTMGDEPLSDLQRNARQRNMLDVYELTTAEWNRRQAERKPVKK